jgi:hypothetical protein
VKEVIYHNKNFGYYIASVTTKNDVDEIIDLIKKKETLAPSKRDAVYMRKREILERNISNGLFVKISRLANNDKEFELLGNKAERIVAISGAYPLTPRPGKVAARIPTETAERNAHELCIPAEMGTGLAIHEIDLPNADGEYPSGCFGKFLAATSILNLFYKAGQIVSGKSLEFDAFVCQVNNRPEMRPIIERLTSEPLSWQIIESPSEQLIRSSMDTTVGKDEHALKQNFFFRLPPTSLPMAADYLLECFKSKTLVSDHTFDKNVVHASFCFNPEFVKFLEQIRSPEISEMFWNAPKSGYMELRRALDMPKAFVPLKAPYPRALTPMP